MKHMLVIAIAALALTAAAPADEGPAGHVVDVSKNFASTYLVEFPPSVKPELRDIFAVTHLGKPVGEVMVLSNGKRTGTFIVAPMASVKGTLVVGDGLVFVRHAKTPVASTNTSGQTIAELNRRTEQVQAAAGREYLAEYAVYEPAGRQALAALEDVTSTDVNFAGFVAKVRVAAAAVQVARNHITQHLTDLYKIDRSDDGLPASYVNMSRALAQYVAAAEQWQNWLNDASAAPGSDKGISGYLSSAASFINAARSNISHSQ